MGDQRQVSCQEVGRIVPVKHVLRVIQTFRFYFSNVGIIGE